jgi:hypothetical protein
MPARLNNHLYRAATEREAGYAGSESAKSDQRRQWCTCATHQGAEMCRACPPLLRECELSRRINTNTYVECKIYHYCARKVSEKRIGTMIDAR